MAWTARVRNRSYVWPRAHPLLAVAAVALLVRFAVVALSDAFEGFVLDDGTYHQMATDMASGDISHWDDFTYSLFWRTAAFLGPITAIYKVLGNEILFGQLYVAVIGAAAVVAGTRLAMEFVERTWALVAGLLLALLPSQAFWSAQLMKDASVWLALITLGLLIAVANRSTGWRLLLSGAGVAVLLCALAFLREHTLVVAAWATMIAAWAGILQQRVQRVAGALLLGVTIPWFVAASGPAGLGLVMNAGSLQELRFKMAQGANTAIVDTTPGGTEAELNEIIVQRQRLEQEIAALERQISETGSASAEPGSGSAEPGSDPAEKQVEEKIEVLRERSEELVQKQQTIQEPRPAPAGTLSEGEGTLQPNLAHLPRGISVMLLEPFPIPFEGSPSLRLARLESLLWYPLLLLGAIGLWRARSHLRSLLFPIVAGGGILLMYALSEGNIGTAHRHRGEFVWVVILLAVLGGRHLWTKKKDNATS